MSTEFKTECRICNASIIMKQINNDYWRSCDDDEKQTPHSHCRDCNKRIYWKECNTTTRPFEQNGHLHQCNPIKCNRCGKNIAFDYINGRFIPVDFNNRIMRHTCKYRSFHQQRTQQQDNKPSININQRIRDYYTLLNIPRDATIDDIRKSFRQLAKQYHPDSHPDDKLFEKRFIEINEAYISLLEIKKPEEED